VGAGDVGQLVARKLRFHREYGINLVGFVDSEPRELRNELSDVPVLGTPDDLPGLVSDLNVDRVVVAFSRGSHEDMVDLVRTLKALDVQVDLVPRLYEAVGPHVKMHAAESLPLLGLPTAKRFPGSATIKRGMDIVGAAVGLVLAAPLFAYAAWRIHRESPGPVFFRQERLGEGMRPFTFLKFRTMRTDVDTSVHREYIKQTMSSSATAGGNGLYKLDRDDAVTPFGRWLRRTSLDELPQLVNVLRGDMSLVGPRPCLAYEVEEFEPHHFERFLVPAGVTGLWQVTARAHATFGEALDMDVAYARGWSLSLDLWLLLRTPFAVLRRGATR
jgi:exopolysaccharide biosynthesis polyprenyl glycosylphosphotransferase